MIVDRLIIDAILMVVSSPKYLATALWGEVGGINYVSQSYVVRIVK